MLISRSVTGQEPPGDVIYPVEPGDTWQTISWRFGLSVAELREANPHPNSQRQPAIGSELILPAVSSEMRYGELFRLGSGGLLQLAAKSGNNPWRIALANDLAQPYTPLFSRPLFVETPGTIPRDLPVGFASISLSAVPATPGKATGFLAEITPETMISAEYAGSPVTIVQEGSTMWGLFGTGAFFPPGDHELTISVNGEPLWSQPWRMTPDTWTFEQITLTGSAAAIDQETIAHERERLQMIWSEVSGPPLWDSPFQLPLNEFLQYSSVYGARRSYNGGPYRSYHEGLDFSAFGGTPVYAPARGLVVLAEFLDVRGGAVIIDHGLGVHSGYYHMSEVKASPGQILEAGDEIGTVGSTGLSTGNHLHWDLLVGTTWVDPASWRDTGMDCWLLSGRMSSCGESS